MPTRHRGSRAMSSSNALRLTAYREARANGRIGYLRLGDPRARMAAAESLRCRLDSDETALARKRYTTLEADLF